MGRACTVLVIEDDPQFRLTLTAYLEDSGYTVLEAADGLEGLEVFTQARPDIVLTDLRMPKLDGLGVIAAIKARSPATPVIAITGTRDLLVEENALSLGAWECLFKPITDLSVLEAAIDKALVQTDNE
jgi:sigma-B regulation protein RsbU (phosphoserine phosphatase)